MTTKILIVEDEFSIALDLQDRLEQLGYEVVGCCKSYEETLVKVVEQEPTIVLMDINIIGEKDGIDTAIQLNKKFKTPTIFITALTDTKTFERAMEAMPYGYVNKPFRDDELKNNIELALHKIKTKSTQDKEESIIEIRNFVFLKSRTTYDKVLYSDILFIEAMDNYTNIHTNDKKYTVSSYLSDFLAELPSENFIRIHRSSAISMDAIASLEGNLVILKNGKSFPIGKTYLKEFLSKFKRFS